MREGLKGVQRFLAGVVLDALGVDFGGVTVDAERQQEIADDAVALAGLLGEGSSLVCQENGAIAGLPDQPVTGEPLQRAVDCGRGDACALGEIDGARLAGSVDQVGDQFDIILGGLLLMRPPDLLEASRLALGFAQPHGLARDRSSPRSMATKHNGTTKQS